LLERFDSLVAINDYVKVRLTIHRYYDDRHLLAAFGQPFYRPTAVVSDGE